MPRSVDTIQFASRHYHQTACLSVEDTTKKMQRVRSLRYHCRELAAITLESVRPTATAFSFLIDSTFIL